MESECLINGARSASPAIGRGMFGYVAYSNFLKDVLVREVRRDVETCKGLSHNKHLGRRDVRLELAQNAKGAWLFLYLVGSQPPISPLIDLRNPLLIRCSALLIFLPSQGAESMEGIAKKKVIKRVAHMQPVAEIVGTKIAPYLGRITPHLTLVDCYARKTTQRKIFSFYFQPLSTVELHR